ncbi:MAG: fumarylacetoacetate hydrolase family protein [Thermodesulfobacteriota bacterium]
MKIIRFQDDTGAVRLGHRFENGSADLLQGDILGTLTDTGRRLKVAKLLSPLAPAAILCIGLNYRLHAGEFGVDLPEYPILFMKNPAAATNPGDPIVIPACCRNAPQVDYEAELAVVIGRSAKNVTAASALEYVLGYTCGNDVTARRWQKLAGGGQWARGKSFDTFCPLGPALVTADEIPDPQHLRISCRLNGELMQDASTADMLFPVAHLIEYLSQDTTLMPGTVILTGTPPGVGFARTPPVWLDAGDRVAIEIEGIGTLENPVTAA